jgi:hypothetical protein
MPAPTPRYWTLTGAIVIGVTVGDFVMLRYGPLRDVTPNLKLFFAGTELVFVGVVAFVLYTLEMKRVERRGDRDAAAPPRK